MRPRAYADVGYTINTRWSLTLVVFNLCNTAASDIDNHDVSPLRGEPLAGIADIHSHPAEPRELRFAVTGRP